MTERKEPVQEIPADRLPPGFAESVEDPPDEPAEPRPAATIVLLRDAVGGPGDAASPDRAGPGIEILMLRRTRSAGFVPGAWVFPGGRVDADDAGPDLVERLDGMTPAGASEMLGLPDDADPPAVAYVIAALREAFEETGILVGRDADGRPAPSAADDPAIDRLRMDLLADEDAFPSILDTLGCRMDGGAVAYVAHWITPVAEPRRYDTRFFAATVPPEAPASPHDAEATAALWIPPQEALDRHAEGRFPMVFPTIRTLEELAGFPSAAAVLDHWAERDVPTILPRLVRTPTGVGIEVPEGRGD